MDKKLEKQLRKSSFPVMVGHLKIIKNNAFIGVSQVANILQVSRPTAKRFMEELIDGKKATGCTEKNGKLCIIMYYEGYTTKEIDSAERAYDNLVWELNQ